ncbi:MAG: hypothetical protein KBC84_05600 [Proteobacteria bacterium]|nr:hypothetical protein [Pseudomonadota bacterium]
MSSEIIKNLMSILVELGGAGIGKGGKNALVSGMRKIGWAKQDDGKGGSKLKGHSLGGHKMGSGLARGAVDLNNYDPKKAHIQRMAADQSRGKTSGTGIDGKKMSKGKPGKLFGRASFSGTESLTGNPKDKWVKAKGTANTPTPKPRSFIKF